MSDEDGLPDGTLMADGFEKALVGVGWRLNTPIAVYDYDRAVRILMERDGMDEEGAEEFMSFNVTGAYVGEGTPLFATIWGEPE